MTAMHLIQLYRGLLSKTLIFFVKKFLKNLSLFQGLSMFMLQNHKTAVITKFNTKCE